MRHSRHIPDELDMKWQLTWISHNDRHVLSQLFKHIALISSIGLLPRTLEEFQQTTTYLLALYTYITCNKINMGKHWPTCLHHKSVSNCYVSPLEKGKTVTGMSSREVQQQKKHRQESRMNTNHFLNERWRRKLLVGSRANRMLDFNSPKSPFLGFWVIQAGYWPDFNFESFIFIKIYLFIKNLTEFHKMVETGVDPHLLWGQNRNVSAFEVHCFCCLP